MGMDGFQISDEFLSTFVPIVAYWVYSGIYALLGSYFESYRFHTKQEEDEKNLVSKRTVALGVLFQQFLQVIVNLLLYRIPRSSVESSTDQQTSYIVVARQFITAMWVMNTWQYFAHRFLHQNKFLYKHIHIHHHRVLVPYAFGALYNHPLEGLLLDTAGGVLSFVLSGMSARTSVFFFTLATIKTVDDHCGLWLPGNLFHKIFYNNTAYHYIHHQLYGLSIAGVPIFLDFVVAIVVFLATFFMGGSVGVDVPIVPQRKRWSLRCCTCKECDPYEGGYFDCWGFWRRCSCKVVWIRLRGKN